MSTMMTSDTPMDINPILWINFSSLILRGEVLFDTVVKFVINSLSSWAIGAFYMRRFVMILLLAILMLIH